MHRVKGPHPYHTIGYRLQSQDKRKTGGLINVMKIGIILERFTLNWVMVRIRMK